jgi:hypothetical protein
MRSKSHRFLKKTPPPRHQSGEKFLLGPIPLAGIDAASKLPGKAALVIYMQAWFRVGVKGTATVKLPTYKLHQNLGLARSSIQRGLAALEGAQLLTVSRRGYQSPIVTVLPCSATQDVGQAPT